MTRMIDRGTVVKIRTSELKVGRGSPAYFLNFDSNGTVHLLTDAGDAMAVRREITVPRTPLPPFQPLRLWLPYGIWTERDGSQVLFSRDYCPLWRISSDGTVSDENPWQEIAFVESENLWYREGLAWLTPNPWKNRTLKKQIKDRMRILGVLGSPPRLIEALDVILRGDAGNIRDAVQVLAPPDSGFPHFPRGPLPRDAASGPFRASRGRLRNGFRS